MLVLLSRVYNGRNRLASSVQLTRADGFSLLGQCSELTGHCPVKVIPCLVGPKSGKPAVLSKFNIIGETGRRIVILSYKWYKVVYAVLWMYSGVFEVADVYYHRQVDPCYFSPTALLLAAFVRCTFYCCAFCPRLQFLHQLLYRIRM